MTKGKYIDALEWLKAKPQDNDEERALYSYDWGNSDSILFVQNVKHAGGNVEIQGDKNDADYPDGDYASAIYITLKPPISRELFMLVADLNPDEFDEVSENKYRYWRD